MEPFISDPDFTLYVGDALAVLRELADEQVDCCVTSPPYWGLRDYGVEGQLGLEPTVEEYVENMVAIFAELRRVLSRSGTLWLNLGDGYAGVGASSNYNEGFDERWGQGAGKRKQEQAASARLGKVPRGLKAKDLMGVPWRLALALQEDGWWLRCDIVWSKSNPMPESVTDRPTKSHEYLFLLSKSSRYFFDQEAVREPAEWARWGDQTNPKHGGSESAAGWIGSKSRAQLQGGRQARRYSAEEFKTTDERSTRFQGPSPVDDRRNIRSVWEIPTQPFPEAHFATYPEELVRRCLLAGCPENGVVLDPFLGSGTTALVARKLGRRSVGIELSEEYARTIIAKRLQQQSLLA